MSVLRIRDVYPGSEFFHPGSRVKKAPDPGSATLVNVCTKKGRREPTVLRRETLVGQLNVAT
jgi:hypothetical protein